jgi:hypothetical protein
MDESMDMETKRNEEVAATCLVEEIRRTYRNGEEARRNLTR